MCGVLLLLNALLLLVGAFSSIVCEGAVVLRLEPLDQAMTDFGYVSGTLVAVAVLLTFGARRQHRSLEQRGQQAAVDPLTGLVTRRVLDSAAASVLGSANGDGTARVLIDIDHFTAVNDTDGHPVGDDALTHIAGILAELSSPDAVISRLGGDELAILLPGAAGRRRWSRPAPSWRPSSPGRCRCRRAAGCRCR